MKFYGMYRLKTQKSFVNLLKANNATAAFTEKIPWRLQCFYLNSFYNNWKPYILKCIRRNVETLMIMELYKCGRMKTIKLDFID